MKRIFASLLAVLLLLPLSITVFADEEKTTVDVTAKYISTIDGAECAPVENGTATVTLPDGTVVTVDGVSGDGLTLVVFPIPKSHTDAWAWFESCMKSHESKLYPMEIYFLDQDGNRQEVTGGITIIVQSTTAYTKPIACSLSTSGKVKTLNSKTDGGKITFSTDGNRYYVLAEKNTGSTPGTDTLNSLQTGDASNIYLWMAVAGISLLFLILLLFWKRKKKEEE